MKKLGYLLLIAGLLLIPVTYLLCQIPTSVSTGVPTPQVGNASVVVAKADATAQTNNIGTTTLYNVPANGAGIYRVSCYAVVTTAGTTSTLAQCRVAWTDNDSGQSAGPTPFTGTVANGTAGMNSSSSGGSGVGFLYVDAAASSTIQYSTASYASTGTPMQYAVHFKLEYLGQ